MNTPGTIGALDSPHLCKCHRRPYLTCHACAHEYCGETFYICPRCHRPETVGSIAPAHPVEFYARSVERLETLTAALKAHPGPAHQGTALNAAQSIGNACYAIEKVLQWLDRAPDDGEGVENE